MRQSFIEALENFLTARDRFHAVKKDGNSFAWEIRDARAIYDENAYKLEEAHKISLMDIIQDSDNAAK